MIYDTSDYYQMSKGDFEIDENSYDCYGHYLWILEDEEEVYDVLKNITNGKKVGV